MKHTLLQGGGKKKKKGGKKKKPSRDFLGKWSKLFPLVKSPSTHDIQILETA